jgi:hypothetical protein
MGGKILRCHGLGIAGCVVLRWMNNQDQKTEERSGTNLHLRIKGCKTRNRPVSLANFYTPFMSPSTASPLGTGCQVSIVLWSAEVGCARDTNLGDLALFTAAAAVVTAGATRCARGGGLDGSTTISIFMGRSVKRVMASGVMNDIGRKRGIVSCCKGERGRRQKRRKTIFRTQSCYRGSMLCLSLVVANPAP